MDPIQSAFYQPVNAPEDALRPATGEVDILAQLELALLPSVEPGPTQATPLIIDMDPADFVEMAPPPANVAAPPEGPALRALEDDVEVAVEVADPVEDLGALVATDFPFDDAGVAPDMSGALPAVQELQASMNPVSIDELRQMVDAGMLAGRTDAYGDRLRYTIRRLVRGL